MDSLPDSEYTEYQSQGITEKNMQLCPERIQTEEEHHEYKSRIRNFIA